MFRKAAFAAIVHSLHLQSSIRRFPVNRAFSLFNSTTMSSNTLQECRHLLKETKLDAFIVGSGDAHQSEYVSDYDMRRQFISGFTGSAGTALILQDSALLWTDGRYFLQASKELSSDWKLMKSGEPNVPELSEWLTKNLQKGQNVGIDARLISTAGAQALQKTLGNKGISLVSVDSNPVDAVWSRHNRPAAPSNPVVIHDISRAGVSHTEKIAQVQSFIRENNASALVVSMLDEIAWLFNIRGSDVAFNPVVISFAVVTLEKAHWFVDAAKVSKEVRQHLGEGVEVHPYEEVEAFLRSLVSSSSSSSSNNSASASSNGANEGCKVLVDVSQLNWRLHSALSGNDVDKTAAAAAVVSVTSPLALSKSLKNEAELRGIRQAHIRDGAALTAFLHWLEVKMMTSSSSSSNPLKETDVMAMLEKFRAKCAHHVGPSFATIAGYGPHGAVIHYHAEEATAGTLGTDSLFLLDSGAQYLDGTTDVTRTMHFGTPTEHMKDCYTAVLKGHIAMAQMVFPTGTAGSRFDCVARQFLWRAGLDYNHGTGHGIGAYLNVHEGPQMVGPRGRPGEKGFSAGMTISNEPGYYEDGAFGIRIENVCIAVPRETPHKFNGKASLAFETVTMVPIQTNLINLDQLTDDELQWLNDYHATVRAAIEGDIRATFPEALDYLIERTQPLHRA